MLDGPIHPLSTGISLVIPNLSSLMLPSSSLFSQFKTTLVFASPKNRLSNPGEMADPSLTAPTGLKGKIASLEAYIAQQNDELAAQRQEIATLRTAKAQVEQHYQQQLGELKKVMVSDVTRMQDEVKRHFAQQKAENVRTQQQVTTLKGEKVSLQQQILGLQRRIQELEEQIGQD